MHTAESRSVPPNDLFAEELRQSGEQSKSPDRITELQQELQETQGQIDAYERDLEDLEASLRSASEIKPKNERNAFEQEEFAELAGALKLTVQELRRANEEREALAKELREFHAQSEVKAVPASPQEKLAEPPRVKKPADPAKFAADASIERRKFDTSDVRVRRSDLEGREMTSEEQRREAARKKAAVEIRVAKEAAIKRDQEKKQDAFAKEQERARKEQEEAEKNTPEYQKFLRSVPASIRKDLEKENLFHPSNREAISAGAEIMFGYGSEPFQETSDQGWAEKAEKIFLERISEKVKVDKETALKIFNTNRQHRKRMEKIRKLEPAYAKLLDEQGLLEPEYIDTIEQAISLVRREGNEQFTPELIVKLIAKKGVESSIAEKIYLAIKLGLEQKKRDDKERERRLTEEKRLAEKKQREAEEDLIKILREKERPSSKSASPRFSEQVTEGAKKLWEKIVGKKEAPQKIEKKVREENLRGMKNLTEKASKVFHNMEALQRSLTISKNMGAHRAAFEMMREDLKALKRAYNTFPSVKEFQTSVEGKPIQFPNEELNAKYYQTRSMAKSLIAWTDQAILDMTNRYRVNF